MLLYSVGVNVQRITQNHLIVSIYGSMQNQSIKQSINQKHKKQGRREKRRAPQWPPSGTPWGRVGSNFFFFSFSPPFFFPGVPSSLGPCLQANYPSSYIIPITTFNKIIKYPFIEIHIHYPSNRSNKWTIDIKPILLDYGFYF